MSLLQCDGKRRGVRFLAVLLVTTAALWASTAAATVMLYLDLPTLVETSDVIVHGRVIDQHTYFDDSRQQVTTKTTVEVARTFWGPQEATVTFRQVAGEWNGTLTAIPGDAKFEPYEEVVLFLVDGKGKYAGDRYLSGLAQAKYTVLRQRGEATVVRDLGSLAFLTQETNEIGHRAPESFTFESFVPELETLVAGIKGGER